MIRVKICGNRTIEEAFMAVRAGADAVGLIVGTRYKTEDELDAHTASEILTALPPYISAVLVTHLISADEVMEIHQRVPTAVIQLQNDIILREITKIKKRLPHVKLIKAIHVENMSAIEIAKSFASYVDALLVDSRTEDRIGGTGMTHDWGISSKIVLQINKPVILAGGLNPSNALEAIRQVRPFGVDVNSGVEFEDGKKDPKKINDFVRLCKNI